MQAERSGGAAGLFTRLLVDELGEVRLLRPPEPETIFALDRDQLAHLRSALAGAHFSALSSSYFMRHTADPGGFAWRITHAGRTVATRDGEAPRGLATLMTALAAIAEQSVLST